jgi:hypothetical protein
MAFNVEPVMYLCRKVSRKPAAIQLVEGRRGHNICIEISGIHMNIDDIKRALTSMDMHHVTTDALAVLQRAIPTAIECSEICQFIAGKHPKYRGISDPTLLGPCERCVPSCSNLKRRFFGGDGRSSLVSIARALPSSTLSDLLRSSTVVQSCVHCTLYWEDARLVTVPISRWVWRPRNSFDPSHGDSHNLVDFQLLFCTF